MSIVKMKKLQLFAARSQKDELLRELMLLGCVEISEAKLSEDDMQALKHETGGTSSLRSKHTALTRALQALDRYAPEKTGLFTQRTAVTFRSFFDETALSEMAVLAKDLLDLDNEITTLSADEVRYGDAITFLRPWESFPAPLELKSTGTCTVFNGTIPASADPAQFEGRILAVAPASDVSFISGSSEVRCISVVCITEEADAALDVLHDFGFFAADFAGMKGTAAENIAACEAALAETSARKKALISEFSSYSKKRTALKTSIDLLGTKLARAQAAEKLLSTDMVLILNGWVPVPRVKELEELLTRLGCAWELTDPTQEETADVPICLKNNSLTRPATMITEMYSLPSYDGIDPNPLIMPFFCLFFGIMFADIAYGLILLAVGLVVKLKIKPRGTLDYIGGLLIACGISSTILGAITGNFFGDVIPVVAEMYGKTVKIPALIDLFENPMVILIGSLVIGFIHIMLGMAINAFLLIRDGKWFDALCDVGSIWLLFGGIALGALGITWLVAIPAVFILIFAQGRTSKSFAGKLGSGMWALYNVVTGYFGDILSYSRLMALMLAGSVIASVFNTLGAMFGNIVFFIIIFILGHALNISLNIIGTFVHTSRLQYLEFFGKFYREGGKPYEPLSITTSNVDIIKED